MPDSPSPVIVLLFGPQAQLAGTRALQVTPSSMTVAAVMDAIPHTCPSLSGSMHASRLAVNQNFSAPEDAVSADDELALIGMVSGG